MTTPVKPNRPAGITEKKKEALDALNIEIVNAGYDVDQFQAIVLSLTQKASMLNGLLTMADSERSRALSNKKTIDQLIQSTLDLKNNAGTAFNETVLSASKTKDLALQIKLVMDKLIYAAQMVNRLYDKITSKKAQNPLISDELVSKVTAAGLDANTAVALALVALKSVFASQASIIESEGAAALLSSQSQALYQLMTANNTAEAKNISLNELINNSYSNAKKYYEQTHEEVVTTNVQLNSAQASLNKAQVKLKSLQMALAAANAAALAL